LVIGDWEKYNYPLPITDYPENEFGGLSSEVEMISKI
jgi:hypothetical protein